jgi:hypothetical protein
LAPAPGGGDFTGIGGPWERVASLIVPLEEAIDRGLHVSDRSKDAALEPPFCEGCEEWRQPRVVADILTSEWESD